MQLTICFLLFCICLQITKETPIVHLSFDVEGWEYDIFRDIIVSKQFPLQVAAEFHYQTGEVEMFLCLFVVCCCFTQQ
jgi:hypothetical protein